MWTGLLVPTVLSEFSLYFLQAMSRVWRDGQKHPVHIYRLLTTGNNPSVWKKNVVSLNNQTKIFWGVNLCFEIRNIIY